MTATQTATFTAANDGTDVANYVRIGGPNAQVVRFFVSGNASSGNPTLELALVDQDGGTTRAMQRYQATCTVSARRTDGAGTGGDYIHDVAFGSAHGGTDKFDLLGSLHEDEGRNAEWRVGITALDGQTTVTVGWKTTEKV